jgi:hypothetical protein
VESTQGGIGTGWEELAEAGENRFAFDNRLNVKFYIRPKLDPAASEAEGRPIFRDVEYVVIKTPGDRFNWVDEPVTNEHRQRFGPRYQMFKAGMAEQVVGSPLSEWAAMPRSLVEELAVSGVRTLEQLADLADGHKQKFRGIEAWCKKAQDALQKSKDEAPAAALRVELAKRDADMATMQKAIDEQAAIIAEMRRGKK